MKGCLGFILLMVVLIIYFTPAVLAVDENCVLLTSIGQNPGSLIIKVVLSNNGYNYEYLPLVTAKNSFSNYNYAILSVGLSQKGIYAADISFEYELNRSKELIKHIKKEDCPIIFIHLGGKSRRDKMSNRLIELVAPVSQYMIVTKSSNTDKYFSNLSDNKNIKLKVINRISKINCVLQQVLTEVNDNG